MHLLFRCADSGNFKFDIRKRWVPYPLRRCDSGWFRVVKSQKSGANIHSPLYILKIKYRGKLLILPKKFYLSTWGSFWSFYTECRMGHSFYTESGCTAKRCCTFERVLPNLLGVFNAHMLHFWHDIFLIRCQKWSMLSESYLKISNVEHVPNRV